jgi:hypothetical protein
VSGPPTIEIFRTVQDSERFAAGDVIFAKGEAGDRTVLADRLRRATAPQVEPAAEHAVHD